jgi:hypothetical protein
MLRVKLKKKINIYKTKSWREFYVILMWGLNNDKIVVKVRGSTNGISNKYNINSFYYATGNHKQRRFQSDDLLLMSYYKLLTWSY